MPGDNTNMEIELIQPIAMDQGLRFAIREGSRTVGAGVVTEVTCPLSGSKTWVMPSFLPRIPFTSSPRA